MIELTCFALLLALVAVRCPRAVWSRNARPAWIATGFGTLSLGTYGLILPASQLDAALGNCNTLTLVRDLCATTSFWFFREAVASYARFKSHAKPLLLIAILLAYTVPFLFISERGRFSVDFIENRTEQIAVWLYASLYMLSIIWLSFSTIRIARRRKALVSTVFQLGYALVIAAGVIEIAYLGLAHFGVGGDPFRRSAYYLSETPFFAGILIIAAGIGWITVGSRLRSIQFKYRILNTRLRRILKTAGPAPVHSFVSQATTPKLRAYEALIHIEALEPDIRSDLRTREAAWISTAQRLFALPDAPDVIDLEALIRNQQAHPQSEEEVQE